MAAIDISKYEADLEFQSILYSIINHHDLKVDSTSSENIAIWRAFYFAGKNAGARKDINFIFGLQQMSQKIMDEMKERLQS